MAKAKQQNYFIKGTLVYPHLKTPDTKFNAAGEYSTKVRVDAEEHERVLALLEPVRDAYIENDPKAEDREDWRKKMPFKKDKESGDFVWSFKQKATHTKADGDTINFSVAIIDASLKPTNANPWGGTVAKLRFTAQPYGMDSSEAYGLSLRPNCVQILELVTGSGGANTEGFEQEEGFEDDGSFVAEEEVEAPVGSDGSEGADF
tara:strand:+ start:402 stop:1013 length:612 start_codon:yes stop_codon:yes gene_type:complete